MCWVMPPASPPATSACRIASSSEVLPWSTWPMMVTTGARGSRSRSSSTSPSMPISTSDSDTRRTRWPNSWITSSAVSASRIWVTLAITPIFISDLMTSPVRVAMRLASSATLMVSGSTTSRTTRTWSERRRSSSAWRRSRSRWRRTEASERVLSSSPSIAACTSTRPVMRRSPTLRGATTGTLRGGRAAPGRRTTPGRRSSSSGRVVRRRSVSAGAAAGAAPGRVLTTGAWPMARDAMVRSGSGATIVTPPRDGSDEGVASAGCAASASRLASVSAAARLASSASARARAWSATLWRSASSAARLASSSRRRASSAADSTEIFSCSRRSASRRAASFCCSSSTRWRVASSDAVSARPAPAGRPAGPPERAGPVAGDAPGVGVGPRFLRTSTCTTFERPWLKLCLTDPASTVRPTSRRAAGLSDKRPLP